MFDRLISLIGIEKFKLIQEKRVLVIGLGGVGGYVTEGLVRSGIENITIIDKDTVDVTNLNRQIIALNSTIGMKKSELIKSRILDINGNAKVESLDMYLTEEDIPKLNLDSYDYVVDAIDDVKVKTALIKYSLDNDINLISSMGTAKKIHPEMLKMTTLDKTMYDPLAKKLRTNLRGYKLNKLKVLTSMETPIKTDDNVLGSTAFIPSIGGLLIASYIINDIIN